jgi:hypothetical protein
MTCWFPGGIMQRSGRLDRHEVVAAVRPDANTLGMMLLRVRGDTAKDIEIVERFITHRHDPHAPYDRPAGTR